MLGILLIIDRHMQVAGMRGAPMEVGAEVAREVSTVIMAPRKVARLEAVPHMAQVRREADPELKEQASVAETGPDEYKTVERAKGMLMQLRGMSESDAYDALHRMASDRKIRIVDVAEKLLSMNDLLS